MIAYLLVFIGGGAGSVLRYITSSYIGKYFISGFPCGTLAVNMLGALIIGMLAQKFVTADNIRLLFITGFLGGFTTFSAFSLESALMFTRQDYTNLALYIALSVAGTIMAVMAGLYIVRGITP